jgi:hypothetical protein
MLLARLETPVTKVYQTDNLQTISVECNYMFAYAKNYGIGKNEIDFEVRFGNFEERKHNAMLGIDVTPADEVTNINARVTETFDTVIRTSQVLNLNEDLKDWTNDDSHVLDVIAQKMGLVIEEKITKDFIIPY